MPNKKPKKGYSTDQTKATKQVYMYIEIRKTWNLDLHELTRRVPRTKLHNCVYVHIRTSQESRFGSPTVTAPSACKGMFEGMYLCG